MEKSREKGADILREAEEAGDSFFQAQKVFETHENLSRKMETTDDPAETARLIAEMNAAISSLAPGHKAGSEAPQTESAASSRKSELVSQKKFDWFGLREKLNEFRDGRRLAEIQGLFENRFKGQLGERHLNDANIDTPYGRFNLLSVSFLDTTDKRRLAKECHKFIDRGSDELRLLSRLHEKESRMGREGTVYAASLRESMKMIQERMRKVQDTLDSEKD